MPVVKLPTIFGEDSIFQNDEINEQSDFRKITLTNISSDSTYYDLIDSGELIEFIILENLSANVAEVSVLCGSVVLIEDFDLLPNSKSFHNVMHFNENPSSLIEVESAIWNLAEVNVYLFLRKLL